MSGGFGRQRSGDGAFRSVLPLLPSTSLYSSRPICGRCVSSEPGPGLKAENKAKIAETLIILLHVTTVQHSSSPSSSSGTSVQCAGPSGTGSSARDDIDVDFAMVKALELAEGGKTIRERRIGEWC